MARVFSEHVEKAVTEAAACRVAVYPRLHGWVSERIQLELGDSMALHQEAEKEAAAEARRLAREQAERLADEWRAALVIPDDGDCSPPQAARLPTS